MTNEQRPCGEAADGEYTEQHRFDWTSHESPCVAVVEGVAEATDRDVTDLDRLEGIVDADALDALLTGSSQGDDSTHVSFTYEGTTVDVYGDGELVVSIPDE